MRVRRGFTLIETAAVVVAAGLALSLTAVSIGTVQPERKTAPKTEEAVKPGANDPETLKANKAAKAAAMQLKDSVQVRGIHQCMVMWAQNNKDMYPLASEVDKNDTTVKDLGTAKDTTANIMSMLLYMGYISPEICVSPAESDDKIKVCQDYTYDRPAKAVKPEQALWDPAFSADFSDGNTGNFSYAHQMPSKSRAATWKADFKTRERPDVGNRAPKILSVTYVGEGVETEFSGKSKTLLIHGEPDTWEGNVAFADNHVDFAKQMWSAKHTFKEQAAEGQPEKTRPDVWFFNEDSDASDTNTAMGIYTRAGASSRNFKPIWD